MSASLTPGDRVSGQWRQVAGYHHLVRQFLDLLKRDQHIQLVYKHAISTIMPMAPVQLHELDDDESLEADKE